MSSLRGHVALVTGGSRGIGAAIARRLAEDGAHVAVTYVNNADAAQDVVRAVGKSGGTGLAVRADFTDAAQVGRAVDEVAAHFGQLDVLVNNAGFMDVSGTPVAEIPLDVVDRTLDVNVRAAFVAAQHAARHLGRGGRVINVGSCLGSRVPGPGATLYAMSKSALTGLTKGLARDLGPRGITVNQVSPGPTDTDMNPSGGPNADAQRALTAVGRYASPEEIAACVAFLAGQPEGFITGADLAVDGGTTA
ncbi:SDR family oxidoreductase [Streptomyces sp. BBFR2]|uniref:SDR family oxidoreductase n=1 Tax=Streptomyces sp. BBFR2 TaxID=3372854 RepID=UPI0037D9A943